MKKQFIIDCLLSIEKEIIHINSLTEKMKFTYDEKLTFKRIKNFPFWEVFYY